MALVRILKGHVNSGSWRKLQDPFRFLIYGDRSGVELGPVATA